MDTAKEEKRENLIQFMLPEYERILPRVLSENKPGNPGLALAVTLGNESLFDSFLEKGLDVDDAKVLILMFSLCFYGKIPKIKRTNTGRR